MPWIASEATDARSVRAARRKRIFARTPGERAFDRCIFPFAFMFICMCLLALTHSITGFPARRDEGPFLPISPEWLDRISLAIGVVLVFLWVRALFSVIRGWNDPAAKHLRTASCILLVPFGWIAYTLVAGRYYAVFAT